MIVGRPHDCGMVVGWSWDVSGMRGMIVGWSWDDSGTFVGCPEYVGSCNMWDPESYRNRAMQSWGELLIGKVAHEWTKHFGELLIGKVTTTRGTRFGNFWLGKYLLGNIVIQQIHLDGKYRLGTLEP